MDRSLETVYAIARRTAPVILCLTLLFLTAGLAMGKDDMCRYCDMKKAQYGHSFMFITLEDGTETGFCSIHCASINMAKNTHQLIKRITVGDYNSHKQIDADSAHWVIGGRRAGVMTARAKWAFETKTDADAYIEEFGGRHATFAKAMKTTFEDMYDDIMMILKKRRMMKIRKLTSDQ